MTTVNCNNRIDDFVKRHLGPWFKTHGFTREKHTWNRRVDTLIDVIDVQSSRWNDERTCDVTLNIGVFVPEVHELCWDGDSLAFVQESDCMVRTRLGALQQANVPRKKQLDRWWSLGDDVSETAHEVIGALSTFALSYLDQMHSQESIQDELDREVSAGAAAPASMLYLAIVRARIGDREGARQVMDAFIDPNLHAWRPRAHDVAQKLRIELGTQTESNPTHPQGKGA